MQPTSGLPFRKMHGAGNDFVILDARQGADPMTPALARALGDRHRGVGFDQLAVIRPARDAPAAADLIFWNSDGTTAGACGNATRCVAWLLMAEAGTDALSLRTERGLLAARAVGPHRVEVDMGRALTDWRDVPLAEPADTLRLPIEGEPSATGMGNPHCTMFVDDLATVDIERLGPALEHHPLFPERTNVQAAQIAGADRIRALVWERGVGRTLASGSSACAVAVSAARRGLTGRRVAVVLEGGTLDIHWREADGHVLMAGPVAEVFEGRISAAFLAAVEGAEAAA